MKVVLIGAGSFVFGGTVLRDAIVACRGDGLRLALVDLNVEAAEAMAAVARRMAAESGVRITVSAHGDRRGVLPGAATANRRCPVKDIERDDAITDKSGAVALLDRLIELHADILPRFRGDVYVTRRPPGGVQR